MCERLKSMRILRGQAKPLCEHGANDRVFGQVRAWYDRPECCAGRLRVTNRLQLPLKTEFSDEDEDNRNDEDKENKPALQRDSEEEDEEEEGISMGKGQKLVQRWLRH
jgi:hypothetical protein